jgi:hypothetical protein
VPHSNLNPPPTFDRWLLAACAAVATFVLFGVVRVAGVL